MMKALLMKQITENQYVAQMHSKPAVDCTTAVHDEVEVSSCRVYKDHNPILTRFGEAVDVRRRGALRMGRFAGSQTRTEDAPAVVRIWTADQCRELTAHQARGLAAQLLAAATLADSQNNH